ncbi:MAG: DUF5320 domain-containing protein [Kiritimatiellae bacterium]|nr:DUF5320 domain-containing protein [Kiritimatiellia bacterium]
MPRGNGTGPGGMGPMTGRGAGFCAGYNTPGYAQGSGFGGGGGRGAGMGYGRGAGMGYGRGGGGFGRRNQFNATGMPGWVRGGWAPNAAPVAQDELAMLKQQAEYFGAEMEGIQARIQELETQKDAK